MKISYKKANTQDSSFICVLNKKVLHYSIHSWDIEWIDMMIRNYSYYILTYDNKRVGAICLSKENSNTINIEVLAISKAYQRKGIGSFAIKLAERVAKKKGCKRIFCGSYCRFKAQGFYEKMGFKTILCMNDGRAWYWDFEKMLKST